MMTETFYLGLTNRSYGEQSCIMVTMSRNQILVAGNELYVRVHGGAVCHPLLGSGIHDSFIQFNSQNIKH